MPKKKTLEHRKNPRPGYDEKNPSSKKEARLRMPRLKNNPSNKKTAASS